MSSALPFHLHLAEIVLVGVVGWLHWVVVPDAHRRRLMAGALVAFLVVTVWPVGDLAASVSLTVATVQRLVIMLLVAPLALLATPTSVLVRLTRPAPVDAVVRRLAHPGVAIFVVTILGTYTLSSPVVDWGARSSLGRDVIIALVLFVGLVLWVPALAIMPGAKRLSPAARAGFIFGSAVVVTSLSFVWIFARHSLYPALQHQYALLHMTPLFDQQLAGFVAKLGCYIPMWAVAFTVFFRADDAGVSVDESPLHWADVERQLLRLDRQRARALRKHRPQ
jgi:cytochrome c oxidase assembly factor CtaG